MIIGGDRISVECPTLSHLDTHLIKEITKLRKDYKAKNNQIE